MTTETGLVYWYQISIFVDKDGLGIREVSLIRIPYTIIRYLNPASGEIEIKEVKNEYLFDSAI